MVLYCISHPSFSTRALVRHLTAHDGEEMVLLSLHPAEKLPIHTNNIKFIWARDRFSGPQLGEVGEVKTEIIKYYDALFEKAGIDIQSLTEIYVVFDGFMAINLYFTFKEIPFVLIEIGANYSTIVLVPSHVHFSSLPGKYKELYTEYGWGKLKKKLYHPNTNKFDGDPPYEYFDYLEILKNLTDEQKEKIFSYLKFDRKPLENKTFSIFFPNSPSLFFANFKRSAPGKDIPITERGTLYNIHIQYFLDFYGDDSVAYKPYPSDPESSLTDGNISNPIIIPSACLAEFLPLIKGLALENIYGMASTSINSLSLFAKRTYRLGPGYFGYFFNLPSIYFLLFLADAHKLHNVTSKEIDHDQIKKYAELAFPELAKRFPADASGKGENSFQIINMREIMEAPGIKEQMPIFNSIASLHYKRAALALINFDYKRLFDDSLFNSGFINKFCLLVRIEKMQTKPKILVDLNDEYILLYVKDPSLRAEILKTNATKALPNTGVKLIYRVFALSEFRKGVREFNTGGGGYKVNYHGSQTITQFDEPSFLQNNVFYNNTGNLFFSNAVYKHLALNPDNQFSKTDYDIRIMPFQNSLEPYAKTYLVDYTKSISESKARVIVVGIGGGGSPGGKMDFDTELKDVHKDFCKAVLNHSASIGVRGEWTRDYLVDILGFPNECIDIIGCPSLRYYGRYFDNICKPYILRDFTLKYMKINTNFTAYAYHKVWADYMNYVWKNFPNSDVLFTDKEEGDLLWNGIEITDKGRLHEDLPQTNAHFMIQQNRTYFHISEAKIIRHLSRYDFSLGTRIHGNVAAVLAGIPVMQIAAGLRQLEIADFHSIPYVLTADLPKYTLEQLYEKSLEGMKKFYANYNKNLQIYVDFLKKNNVPVNYEYLTPDPNEYPC
ncbi:MAG: polysaccharide pyruvyl transferase family protein [Treponema sp.]|nr:polysaccharide pyruvyl transferase family protein [Treponema sp.]